MLRPVPPRTVVTTTVTGPVVEVAGKPQTHVVRVRRHPDLDRQALLASTSTTWPRTTTSRRARPCAWARRSTARPASRRPMSSRRATPSSPSPSASTSPPRPWPTRTT
ncbi:hypothetical protein ACRAWD_24800 [Caulobacter segnis]